MTVRLHTLYQSRADDSTNRARSGHRPTANAGQAAAHLEDSKQVRSGSCGLRLQGLHREEGLGFGV